VGPEGCLAWFRLRADRESLLFFIFHGSASVQSAARNYPDTFEPVENGLGRGASRSAISLSGQPAKIKPFNDFALVGLPWQHGGIEGP